MLGQFWHHRCSAMAVCHARAVAGQFSPVQCPSVGPCVTPASMEVSSPVARIPHWNSSGPPEAFSPPFSPLCSQIRGLFPTTEFAVASSSSLPNPDDLGATLARACLNSGNLTTVERSSAAHSRSSLPGLISPVRF
jgi:hypothetical protein